ncbi:TIGR04255 family protein [Mesorhizobium sp. B2-5-9]|uniref:TIGR04255 family protein n=1 Tax=Mesorhizobium sp. B2-5-9 TaxID=2589921 RepID=UPI0015E4777B|nr:TIGR04255 family protein [Mesorhizobium sp. B2-5-9]
MSETLRFDPIYSEHAIERCAWTVAFSQPLPEKLYLSVVRAAGEDATKRGYQPVQYHGIQFNPLTGQVLAGQPGGPVEFVAPDGAVQLNITPQSVTFASTRYVRWQPFFGQVSDWPLSIAARFGDIVDVGGLKLEYWDRFIWSGDWSDFDPNKLLRADTPYVAPGATRGGNAWHSHVGWFEKNDGAVRRLVNINIDCLDFMLPNTIGPKPSMGVYTMIQDSFFLPGSLQIDVGVNSLKDRSTELHLSLKTLIGSIISDDMQNRISLNNGARSNVR